MQYTNNNDGSVVTAYYIRSTTLTSEGNYSITLPEVFKIIGLHLEQTADYVPVEGDFYIDKGDIVSSSVMKMSEFAVAYIPPVVDPV